MAKARGAHMKAQKRARKQAVRQQAGDLRKQLSKTPVMKTSSPSDTR